jgi:hypothetical protein
MNGGGKFIPVPFWDSAKPIPPQLNNNNNNVNLPLPANVRSPALKSITSYKILNNRLLPYHAAVHNGLGGHMPIHKPHRRTRFYRHSILSW